MHSLHAVVAYRPLWNSLVKFGNNVHSPWLVIGDFNCVLSANGRCGSSQIFSYKVRDFEHCCVDLELIDIKSTCYHFTWTNNHAWSKIDPALCNQARFYSGLQATVRFLPLGCLSDNSPYLSF